jgi:hypothetical protein
MIHDECWWSLTNTNDPWWMLMIHDECWWSMMSTDDPWWVLMIHDEYWWSIMTTDDPWWVLTIHDDYWWSIMIHDGYWWSMMITNDPWWSMMGTDIHGSIHGSIIYTSMDISISICSFKCYALSPLPPPPPWGNILNIKYIYQGDVSWHNMCMYICLHTVQCPFWTKH